MSRGSSSLLQAVQCEETELGLDSPPQGGSLAWLASWHDWSSGGSLGGRVMGQRSQFLWASSDSVLGCSSPLPDASHLSMPTPRTVTGVEQILHKYRDFLYPLTPHVHSFSLNQHPLLRGTFVPNDEPTLICHHHSKSTVYIRVHLVLYILWAWKKV